MSVFKRTIQQRLAFQGKAVEESDVFRLYDTYSSESCGKLTHPGE